MKTMEKDFQYQFGNHLPGDREGYETACRAYGVKPHTDAELKTRAYALEYAEYDMVQWREKMTREQRVYEVLDAARWHTAKKEQLRPEPESVPTVMCACGHRSAYPMSTASGSSCPDCYDRMEGEE